MKKSFLRVIRTKTSVNEYDANSLDSSTVSKRKIAVMLFSGVALIMVLVLSIIVHSPGDEIGPDMCLTANPAPKHTVFLIDTTDGYSDNQIRIMRQEIEHRIEGMQGYEKLSIYVIKSDESGLSTVISKEFCRCKINVDSINPWTGSEKFIKEKFEKQFYLPLKNVLDKNLTPGKKANKSPILEALYTVSLDDSFLDAERREIIIFSDMHQNSDLISFYRSVPSFDELLKQIPLPMVVMKAQNKFRCEVTMYRPSHDRNSVISKRRFWQQYFAFTGSLFKFQVF